MKIKFLHIFKIILFVLFYFDGISQIPTITSFSPTSGCAGTDSVVISGTNFLGASSVEIGGTNVQSFVVNNDTQITVILGPGTTGNISVTTPISIATSADTFTVINPGISIIASPDSVCKFGTATLSTTWTSPSPIIPPIPYCNSIFKKYSYKYEYITNVTFAGINNTSEANGPYPVNYLAQTANVTAGNTYLLSVTIHPYENEYIYVWIDWNQNGIFETPEEKYTLALDVDKPGPYAAWITVPVNTRNGNTRMRVMLAYYGWGYPCVETNYGEAEDYTVHVSGGYSSGLSNISWTPSTYLNATNMMSVTASNVTSPTTYTVTATSSEGCTTSNSVTLTVNPLPTVTATPASQTICLNGEATIAGGGAVSYFWTGGIKNNKPFVVTENKIYTVTGIDANGCSNTATAVVNAIRTIILNNNPIVSVCQKASVTLSGNASGGEPPYTYEWTGNVINDIPFVAEVNSSHTLTATDNIGCKAVRSVLLKVTPLVELLAPFTSTHSQNHADGFDINYYDGNCYLIATVTDGKGGNVLGLTTATVNVDSTAGVYDGQLFVRRWYEITPTSNGQAGIKLGIYQSDFDDYNSIETVPYLRLPTGATDTAGIANIRITRIDDGLGNNSEEIIPLAYWNGRYWELTFSTTGFGQFRVHSVNANNIPISATVINFSGIKKTNSDLLSWATSIEQNNGYFNLQHSTDGVNFNTIAKVNSKALNGNSQERLDYSVENTQPQSGHNYYRIEYVDLYGRVKAHEKVIDLIWGADGSSSVNIYPNPTTDILNIDLNASKSQNTIVKVFDISGRVVKQAEVNTQAGLNNIQLSFRDLASGLYTVGLYSNNDLIFINKVRRNRL